MQNTARQAFEEQPISVQHWVSLQSLKGLHFGLQRVKERASSLVQRLVQDEMGITTPSFFNDLVGATRQSLPVQLTSPADVTETNVQAILDQEFGHFKERLNHDLVALHAAAVWYCEDQGARFRTVNDMMTTAPAVDREPAAPTVRQLAQQAIIQRKLEKQSQPLRRKAHAAIKKATKLFTRFGEEDNLRLIVSGQEVTLSHDDSPLKFVLKPVGEPGWLEKRTTSVRAHTPYDLTVLTKEDVYVTKLCVYMDQTPVLDQLLALTLFIKAGDEEVILRKANWYGMGGVESTQVLLDHYPKLKNKLPAEMTDGSPHGLLRGMVHRMHPEIQHWAPYKDRVEAWISTWLEPVTAPSLALSQQLGFLRLPELPLVTPAPELTPELNVLPEVAFA